MNYRNSDSHFRAFITLILILFCVFLCCYTIIEASLSFMISDTEVSLETSLHRENKQRYEYDQVSNALPAARQSLNELLPQAEDCLAKVNELKSERKALRTQKEAILRNRCSEGDDPE